VLSQIKNSIRNFNRFFGFRFSLKKFQNVTFSFDTFPLRNRKLRDKTRSKFYMEVTDRCTIYLCRVINLKKRLHVISFVSRMIK